MKKHLFTVIVAAVVCRNCCYADAPQHQDQSVRNLATTENACYVSAAGGVAVDTDTGRWTFWPGSRKLTLDGVLIWLNAPARADGDDLLLDRVDMDKAVLPLLRLEQTAATRRVHFVVIDPGHGGQDSGAQGSGMVPEKTIVLDIAQRVRRKLQISDMRARLTRDGDQTLSLGARTDRAARWDADVFISIHVNSSGNPTASGIETYVLPAPGYPSTSGTNGNGPCPGNAYDAISQLLAYHVHKGMLVSARVEDRGLRRARFEVLRNAKCAAILVECGFLSNPREARNLENAAYRDAVAEGIARGLLTGISICNRP